MENTVLVKKIREYCKLRGTSITQLENQLEFSAGLVSRWTKMSPSIDKIIEVANFLDVSLDELTGRCKEKNQVEFAEKLSNMTADGYIMWKLYNRNAPFTYPMEYLKDGSAMRWLCAYSIYEEGFFVLTRMINESENKVDMQLYIVPGKNAVPVLQSVSSEELLELWEYVEAQVLQKENIKEAERLKAHFLNSDGVLPDDEDDQMMRDDSKKIVQLLQKDENRQLLKVLLQVMNHD